MRIIKNNYKPRYYKVICQKCFSELGLNVDEDIKPENIFNKPYIDGEYRCPCCKKYNIIRDFYK